MSELSARTHKLATQLVAERSASRLAQQDATLWGTEAAAEAGERLNWVHPFDAAPALIASAVQLRQHMLQRGCDRVVLCGMGGSSLGPEVIARWADASLTLLDSTHPAVVQRVIDTDLERTTVVVSSKSGSTIETRSHLACFEVAFAAAGIDASERVVVVTDPGSELEQYATERGYVVFQADPHVGGRFSVLTAFGIVPSVLAGIDVDPLFRDALATKALCIEDSLSNPAIQLAARIVADLPTRYVLCATEASDRPWGLGDWIEQLVAESTGKQGVGVLPISLHPDAVEFQQHESPHATHLFLAAGDTVSVASSDHTLTVHGSLGAQFYLWEYATALIGHLMHIDPFNQPDVESAKSAARAALLSTPESPVPTTPLSSVDDLLTELRARQGTFDYIALQAYIDASGSVAPRVRELRDRLALELQTPVALGIGPRYLHSTGQLHKGGPQRGAFVQVIDSDAAEYVIPHSGGGGFAELITAQALGDRTVLESHERYVAVISATQIPAPV